MGLSGGTATSSGQYMGSTAGLSALLGPLRQSGASISIGSADYLAVMKRWAACSGRSVGSCARFAPEAFVARSDYVGDLLSARGRAAAIEASRSATLLLDAYGGAINQVGADATAFVHRDQLFSIQYLAYGAGARGRVNTAYRQMRPFVSGEAYQNYIDPQLSAWRRAYYAGNWSRLVRVARKYDPDEVFAFRQGIDQ
ncbi:MAG: BBE domain-containing protein [Thermoleophilaceae bacterium]|nr:BBE domain-containing protein [Thermoleophilaceae bacterium]